MLGNMGPRKVGYWENIHALYIKLNNVLQPKKSLAENFLLSRTPFRFDSDKGRFIPPDQTQDFFVKEEYFSCIRLYSVVDNGTFK